MLVPRGEGDIVSSEHELLGRAASQSNLVGLAQISAILTPRIELRDVAWSRTVNFVVGDSFINRLIYWNGLHYAPVWVDGLVALKVSEEDLNDPDRFNVIMDIVKKRISLRLDGSASQTQIAIRSSSVAQSELDRIAGRLRAANPFNTYTSEHLDSVDAVVPSRSTLESPGHHFSLATSTSLRSAKPGSVRPSSSPAIFAKRRNCH
jgi:hypothetical protein